jgi:proteasome accessory factor B
VHVADAVERLVNLALYLAEAREPVGVHRIRVDVAGYDPDQDEETFLRMFERDKDLLRVAGFVIIADEDGRYVVDRSATFAADVELDAIEAAAVRAAASAFLADPSFPFAADLRLALAKIASAIDSEPVASAARLVDEDPERQGVSVELLSDAATRRKRVTFAYTNSRGITAPREIEPYGLFLFGGRWYVVGRDVAKDEVRTYTVARATDINVNAKAPKAADFERPADFDVAAFSLLAFEYGPPEAEFSAVIGFAPSVAWRAQSVAGSHGRLERRDDGSAAWHVRARNRERLLRFVLENGPGLALEAPAQAAAALRAGLEEVARLHG